MDFKCPKCKKTTIHWTGKPQRCPNPVCNAGYKRLKTERLRILTERANSEAYKESAEEALRRYDKEFPSARIPRATDEAIDKYVERLKKEFSKIKNRKALRDAKDNVPWKKRDIIAEAVRQYLLKVDPTSFTK